MDHEISFIGQGGRLLDTVKANHFTFISLGKDRFRPSLIYAFQIYKYGKTINPDVLIGVGIPTGMEASLAAYLLKKPILFIMNVSPRNMFWTGNSKWQFPQISDMVVVNAEFKELCIQKYGWDEDKIHYIPQRLLPQDHQRNIVRNSLHRIAIVRRLDIIKSQPVIYLLDRLQNFLQAHENISVDIIGDGSNYDSVVTKSCEVNKQINRSAINCIGYIDDIENKLGQYDLVIGTEKVVFEALSARKATAIIRNDGTLIPVTANNICVLSYDNFIGSKLDLSSDIDFDHLLKYVKGYSQGEGGNLGDWIERNYDYKIGAGKISMLLEEISVPKFFLQKYVFQLIRMYISIFSKILKNNLFQERRK
jgi:hypothetical protein